jgi:chorismate mutase
MRAVRRRSDLSPAELKIWQKIRRLDEAIAVLMEERADLARRLEAEAEARLEQGQKVIPMPRRRKAVPDDQLPLEFSP